MPMYLCKNEGSKGRKQAGNYFQCSRVTNSLHSNFLAFRILLEISNKKFKHFWHFVRKNDNLPIECSLLLSTPNTQSSKNTATKKLHSWHPKYYQVMKMQPLIFCLAPKEQWTIPQVFQKESMWKKLIYSQKQKDFFVMMLPRWDNKTGWNWMMRLKNMSWWS